MLMMAILEQTLIAHGFKKMLQDIEDGKINCIITKDLSRFGRDHIDTGYYLERYLPTNNIRYIAIRRWNRHNRFKRFTIFIF